MWILLRAVNGHGVSKLMSGVPSRISGRKQMNISNMTRGPCKTRNDCQMKAHGLPSRMLFASKRYGHQQSDLRVTKWPEVAASGWGITIPEPLATRSDVAME